MNRECEVYLGKWKNRSKRKPLIVRGARQVGKTYTLEKFGSDYFDDMLTVNLEHREELHLLFEQMNPKNIIQELGLFFGHSIVPGKTLLFFDEIQACPKAIACLRYFYEQIPELHVVAAGSLLDFSLREFKYSMPVGRLEYLYMNPLTFCEFLQALGEDRLVDYMNQYNLSDDLSDVTHNRIQSLLRLYYFIGGMPEAVETYVEQQDLTEVQRILSSIVATLIDDFAKYGTRLQQQNMRKVIRFCPRNIGRKVRYVNIDRMIQAAGLRNAFELLELTRIITLIRHTSANGLPLAAEASDKHFKPLLLDIGLCNNLCGLQLTDVDALLTTQEGGLAEQFVGQEIRALGPIFEDHSLFYWHREARNSNAEVDYVWPYEGRILPVEVRAGTSGSLKSTHVFLSEKNENLAIRFNQDKPSVGTFTVKHSDKKGSGSLTFTLISLPLYMVGQLERMLSAFQ